MLSETTLLEGQYLIAMPGMGDNRFEKSIIYLCAHSPEGSMGFIINKTLVQPSPVEFLKQLNIVSEPEVPDIPELLAKGSLYSGGPVEPGRGFVLHTADYFGDSTIKIDSNVCLTATLEILREIAVGKGPKKYMISLGYSGWSSGQLEDEISANGWLITKTQSEIIFDDDNSTKYIRVMQQMGINPSTLSSQAGHA